MNLAESMKKAFKSRVTGIWFTAPTKEYLCLNLKRIFEQRGILIPNDPILISEIHSIRRRAGVKSMLYDADKNTAGHADRFWAFALATGHADAFRSQKKGKSWVM